jgi:hypothetical protein
VCEYGGMRKAHFKDTARHTGTEGRQIHGKERRIPIAPASVAGVLRVERTQERSKVQEDRSEDDRLKEGQDRAERCKSAEEEAPWVDT